jgi:hypothetical protein
MYKVLWRNSGTIDQSQIEDKISFYFTWENLMQKTPTNNILVVGPNISGYQMVRLDSFYIKCMTNSQPSAIVFLPGDANGDTLVKKCNAITILSVPGARLLRPNLSQWDTTGTGPYGFNSEPGSQKGRTFKLKFYSPLHTWNHLTSTSQAELDWKKLPWFQGLAAVFDPSQPSLSPTTYPTGKYDVTWKGNLYVTYGQYEAGLGATAPTLSQHLGLGAEPPGPFERDDHLISTAVALHKCGATDCVDLTDLDDVKVGPKGLESPRPGGSSDPFLTPLLPPPVEALPGVTVLDDIACEQMSEVDSCSESEDETDFE